MKMPWTKGRWTKTGRAIEHTCVDGWRLVERAGHLGHQRHHVAVVFGFLVLVLFLGLFANLRPILY